MNEFLELGLLPYCTSCPIDFPPELLFPLPLLPCLAQAHLCDVQGMIGAGVEIGSSGSERPEILSA